MPELPEVETTRQAIIDCCVGKTVSLVNVKRFDLRWEVPKQLASLMLNKQCMALNRRGKYLVFIFPDGALIVHLGMSGSLRIVSDKTPWRKHDHLELGFDKYRLRYHDPRRFGCVLWADDWENHELIRTMGVEPLSDEFSGSVLYQLARGKKCPIKSLIMNGKVVTGVGNIYACEALFKAGICPQKHAGKITKRMCDNLADAIKSVMSFAIKVGGTTLRDFVSGASSPGYFQTKLDVYGREGKECRKCQQKIKNIKMTGRSTFYCPTCQP